MTYKILWTSCDWSSLEKKVQEHLDKGWKLLGPPQAVHHEGHRFYAFQAVTLEPQTKSESE